MLGSCSRILLVFMVQRVKINFSKQYGVKEQNMVEIMYFIRFFVRKGIKGGVRERDKRRRKKEKMDS